MDPTTPDPVDTAGAVVSSIPSIDHNNNVTGDVASYANTLRQYDPDAYAAIKNDPTGQALITTIQQDKIQQAKIDSAPPGTDPLQDLDTYSYAYSRGLLPKGPGALSTLGQAAGDLWSGVKGVAELAVLVGRGAVETAASNDTTKLEDSANILVAGVKKGIGDGALLAGGAGDMMYDVANAASEAIGQITPQQRRALKIQGDWTMYKAGTAVAASQKVTQDNLEAITKQDPKMLQNAVTGLGLAMNPGNLVPADEAFSAVAGTGSRILGIGAKSLPGVTDGLATDLMRANSAHVAANAAHDALVLSRDTLEGEGGTIIAEDPAVQAAAKTVQLTKAQLDAADAAYQASRASDEAAQAKALSASPVAKAVGNAAQAVGATLQLPAKLADYVTTGVDNFAERVADGEPMVKKAIKTAASAAAGGVAGTVFDELDPDSEHNPFLAFAAGALGPQALKWVGSDMKAAGQQLVLGRVGLPYFARLAADTAATGPTRWVAGNVLDPLTPFAAPLIDKMAAGVKGAAVAAPIGAAFGFVQSGGSPEGAIDGAAGILPLGFVGGLAGSMTEAFSKNQAAQTGEANRQYLMKRWAGNSVAMKRFNDLSIGQQTQLANWVHASPDFTPLFLNSKTDVDFMKSQGALPLDARTNTGGGITFKGQDGKVYVAINPDDPKALGPVIAHELRHVMQMSDPALTQDVQNTLVGNAENGTPGIFTRRDAAGEPVVIRNADGTQAYDTTDEYKALKKNYSDRVSAAIGSPYTLSDSAFALEHDAEESAQTWLQTDSFDQSIRPTVSGILANKFQDVPFLRTVLAKFGHSFSLDGDINSPSSAFKGLAATPDTQKLVQAYTDAWARRSPDAVAPESPGVDMGPDAVAKNPGLLDLLDASTDLNRDPKTGLPAGVTVDPVSGKMIVSDPSKLFKKASQVNADVKAMSDAVIKAVNDSVAANPAVEADAVQPHTQEDGTKVIAGRYFTTDQIARIKASGAFNEIQLRQLLNLNGLLQSGKSNFIRSFYQAALRSGRYASRSGHWVEEIPYGFKVTKADNITIQNAAPDKLARNLEQLWANGKGPARGLWNNTADMFRDADQYLRDLGAGKPGASTIGDAKRDAINAALGIKGSGRSEVNPVYDATPQKSLTPAIVSRRLDRTNRMQPGLRADAPAFTHKTYEAARENFNPGDVRFMPEDVTQTDAGGKTDGAEDKEVPALTAAPKGPAASSDVNASGAGQGSGVLPDVRFTPGEDLEADAKHEISTRVPTATKATEDPIASHLVIGAQHVLADADKKKAIASLVAQYPGTPAVKSVAARLAAFHDDVVGNLLWLHDQVPAEIRDRSKLWYDGGRKLATDFSEKYGISRPSAAAAFAALSPQKDWYMNVDLARRTIETHAELKGKPLAPELAAWYAGKFGEKDPTGTAEIQQAVGTNYDELTRKQKAVAVRAYDELNNARDYPIVNPEGTFGDLVKNQSGANGKVAWGDFGSIGKAISVLEDGSRENISKQLGEQHKVRNFYNNILLPNDPNSGHVTIDTHAVAAGLLRPLAGSDREVLQNFGGDGAPGSSLTGASGTYGVYADAYREAAEARGILPREMQSITWEAVRGLFPAEFKTTSNKAAVDAVWKQYKTGALTIDEARNQILNLAGGIEPPSWVGSGPR